MRVEKVSERENSSHLSDDGSGEVSQVLLCRLEIETVHQALRHPRVKSDANPTIADEPDQCQLMNYDVIPLHSDLSIDDQMNIFTQVKNTYRKAKLALFFLTRTKTFLFRSTDYSFDHYSRLFDRVRGLSCQ